MTPFHHTPLSVFSAPSSSPHREFLPESSCPLTIVLYRTPDGVPQTSLPHTYVYHTKGPGGGEGARGGAKGHGGGRRTGFDWGSGHGVYGAGCADLALNVLCGTLPPPEAFRLHLEFKRDWISRLPAAGKTIYLVSVRAWVKEVWKREDEAAAARGIQQEAAQHES